MPIDTPDWVRDAVFYQIFPDRFARSARLRPAGPFEPWEAPPTLHGFKGGDLLGIAERLPELDELGITALYLTPIFSSASNHRYHAYDYLAVDPLLGGDAALRELLDRAHDRGIRVILDGVFNHCGRGFWPFHHVLENGASSPYRDWFHLDPAVLAGERAAERLSGPRRGERAAPSATGPGGACRPCPSSTSTIPPSASTSWGSPSTGSASASTAGASTCPARSTTRRSGRSSDGAAGRSTRRPTSSARSGTRPPTGSAATGSTP